MKIIKSIALIFLMITFIACNTTDSDFSPKPVSNPFSEASYIDGTITNVSLNQQGDSIEKILIEEKPGKLNSGNKIHFSLTEVTDILLQKKDGSLKPFAKEDLSINFRVRGWSNGIIIDTYPPQSEAKRNSCD